MRTGSRFSQSICCHYEANHAGVAMRALSRPRSALDPSRGRDPARPRTGGVKAELFARDRVLKRGASTTYNRRASDRFQRLPTERSCSPTGFHVPARNSRAAGSRPTATDMSASEALSPPGAVSWMPGSTAVAAEDNDCVPPTCLHLVASGQHAVR